METNTSTLDLFKHQVSTAVLTFQNLEPNDKELAFSYVQSIVFEETAKLAGKKDPAYPGQDEQNAGGSCEPMSDFIPEMLHIGNQEDGSTIDGQEARECNVVANMTAATTIKGMLSSTDILALSNTKGKGFSEGICDSSDSLQKELLGPFPAPARHTDELGELKTNNTSARTLELALEQLKEENDILKEKIVMFCEKAYGRDTDEYNKLLTVIEKPVNMVVGNILEDIISQTVDSSQITQIPVPDIPMKRKRGRPPKKRPIETGETRSESSLGQSKSSADILLAAMATSTNTLDKKIQKRKNPNPKKLTNDSKKEPVKPTESINKGKPNSRLTRYGRKVSVKKYDEPEFDVDFGKPKRSRGNTKKNQSEESAPFIYIDYDRDDDDNDENSAPVFELDESMKDPDFNPLMEIPLDPTVIDNELTCTLKSFSRKLHDKLGRKHKKVIRHTCRLCNKAFTHGRPFKRHLKTYGFGSVSCRFCRIEYYNSATMLHHRCSAGKFKKGEERSCQVCQETFTNAKKLTKHLKVEHALKNAVPNYFCPHCGRGFVKRPSLYIHLKDHAGDKVVCTKCGEFLDDEEAFLEHTKDHTSNANFVCDKCGALFMRKQQYDQHLAAHTKYDCLICSMAFSHKKLLLKHCKTVHKVKVASEEPKYHQCAECGKVFQRPGLLELHMRIHTGERPIECGICKMFFRTPKALAKHKQTRTHMTRSGDMPRERVHLCSVCGRSYYRKQALLRHMKYHTEDKPFTCPHCNYSCRENNNLKRHIALHFSVRDFVCETCGAAFHAKKTLEQHKVYKHSEDRPFVCEDCSLTFKTPNALKRHYRIHVNTRQHKCPHCQAGFNRLYNLRRHVKQVHHTDNLMPPPNRVKLLDVPEGQEFHKGPAALGLQGKPTQLPRQPRQKRKPEATIEAPVEVESVELSQNTAHVAQVATVETVSYLPQVFQTDPHTNGNQVVLQPVQSSAMVQGYYTTTPDGRLVYHGEEQPQIATTDQRLIQDQYQSQDMYSAVSNLLHLMHNTDTQTAHLLPASTLAQPTQSHNQTHTHTHQQL